jgi:ABC-type branched-subunit amino acid transport system ATPase component
MYVKDIFPTLTILENLQLANSCDFDDESLSALFNGWCNLGFNTEFNIVTVKAGELSGGEKRLLMNLMTFIA